MYYRPMKKESKYGEDICRYREIKDSQIIYYVRACEKGKYCEDLGNEGINSGFSICQDLPTRETGISTLNGECSSDFDCENDLECVSKKCTYTGTACSTGQAPYKPEGTSSYRCSKLAPEGYCEVREYSTDSSSYTSSFGSPQSKYQKCGLYTFHPAGSNVYKLKDTKYVYIGSVDNGEYVKTPTLCKTGFALPFYPNNNLEDPSTPNSNKMYFKCVTPISIDKLDPKSSCVIYYKEKDDDTEIKKYNYEQLGSENLDSTVTTNVFYSNVCSYSNKKLQISLQKLKEYSNTIKDEERDKCGNLENDKNSCDNNELIKMWYFYENPEDYILYNEREDLEPLLNYFIQTEYHSYEFTRLININYFIILLFLLFL